MARKPITSRPARKKAQEKAVGLPMANGGVRGESETGRIPDYQPEYCEIAFQMCAGEDPATDIDLADEFGVTKRTILRWRQTYPDFALACKLGKGQADDRVERSLYARATGYDYPSEEIKVVEGQVVRVPIRIHVPPDPTCMMKWLHNRRPKDWRERQEIAHTGPDGGAVQYVVQMPELPASVDEWLKKSK